MERSAIRGPDLHIAPNPRIPLRSMRATGGVFLSIS